MNFFYVKLPVGTSLEGREHHFHDGLEAALTAQHLGTVIGWGDSLSSAHANEPVHLAFHRIDIEVTEVTSALTLLQRTLVALDAPLGTEIHYTLNGATLQDISSATGWRTEPCHSVPRRPARRT
ncbi:hypothetical protein [Rhodoferax sp.]|uniref:hypothetical protein n=1 Tax=Rhodoferax sp. TaxID=50421 RepID=UPI002848BC4B|nr:hypothetical protein [Rhodoferax sp.]MDR3369860.1 hypothetical protein [Rhodoferax sp.]